MFALNSYSLRTKLLFGGLTLIGLETIFSFGQISQLVFFAIGILLTGIPHGSLDHILYLNERKQENTLKNLSRFLFFYLGYALLYAFLWYLSPQLAILLFIMISAYHFGEMDLKAIISGTRLSDKLFSTSYGLLFLGNYLLFRWTESQAILSSFPGFQFNYTQQIQDLYVNRQLVLLISILFMVSLLVIYYLKHFIPLSSTIKSSFQLFVLGMIVFNLPILLGFGFYFSCWHAGLSIVEIRKSLGWEHKSWIFIFRQSLPTNLAALAMVLVLLYFFYGDLNRILAILFMAIAILTAPHIQVISSMLAKNRSN